MGMVGIEGTYAALLERFGERVTRDRGRLETCAWDFGGVVRRAPSIVAEPASVDETLAALRIAGENGMPIAVRGSGHSQSGQCLTEGSLVLETRRMNGVRVDPDRGIVVAEGGATWRQVVDAAFAHDSLPLGPTYVVDTTVAGTLSVGGVGSESIRVGAQVDNVLGLDVATMDGRVISCSADENVDLFDAVRAGLGQFGVIVRATYPIRRSAPRLRTYFFLYEDAAAFVSDLTALQERSRSAFVGGFVTRDGPRHVLLLALGREFTDDAELDDRAMAEGLRATRALPSKDSPVWDASGVPGHIFFRMHTGAAWSDEGAPPPMVHPWVDHMFATETAATILDQLLKSPPSPLRMGTCGIIPVAAAARPAPLFAVPPSAPSSPRLHIGVGMFPRVPRGLRADAIAAMREYSAALCASGGTRYLSGFVDFDAAQWAAHYGAAWPHAREMKRRYDPQGLLNPGFVPLG
jgi:FAD/FMN-containing dehydrogenase